MQAQAQAQDTDAVVNTKAKMLTTVRNRAGTDRRFMACGGPSRIRTENIRR